MRDNLVMDLSWTDVGGRNVSRVAWAAGVLYVGFVRSPSVYAYPDGDGGLHKALAESSSVDRDFVDLVRSRLTGRRV